MRLLASQVLLASSCAGVALSLTACEGPSGSASLRSSAQALSGTLVISGRVTRPTGEPISGATMELAGSAVASVTTDADGLYVFPDLDPGSYTVTPRKAGLEFCSPSAQFGTLRRDVTEDFSGAPSGCLAAVYRKKVLVLNYDPAVTTPDGVSMKLSVSRNWDDATQLAGQYQRAMESMSNGRVRYSIEETRNLGEIPVKEDGFAYSPESLLACLADTSTCHAADTADYRAIVSSQGICGEVNAGTIDEVWLFGGPYFGFYESRLAGPSAFFYNSPPLDGTTCERLVPIMGFNYERSIAEMVHDFMHRTESTMARVYGSWAENRLDTNWDRFALVAAQSPSFGYSGCGTAHFAPNSMQDYQYDNPAPVSSFCDDFLDYPDLNVPASFETVTCAAWGCRELGYYRYFLQHLPRAAGTACDGKFSDWWRYVISPDAVSLTDASSARCGDEDEGEPHPGRHHRHRRDHRHEDHGSRHRH